LSPLVVWAGALASARCPDQEFKTGRFPTAGSVLVTSCGGYAKKTRKPKWVGEVPLFHIASNCAPALGGVFPGGPGSLGFNLAELYLTQSFGGCGLMFPVGEVKRFLLEVGSPLVRGHCGENSLSYA